MPITVGTNGWNETSLHLKTLVGLAGGNVHLGFEGATAPFEVWAYDCRAGEYVQLASSDGEALDIPLADWRLLSGVSSSDADFETPVLVTASAGILRYQHHAGRVRDKARHAVHQHHQQTLQP